MAKKYQLKEEDKNWIEEAYAKGLTILEMIKKLEEAGYPKEKLEKFEEYYEIIEESQREAKEKEIKIEDEKQFKESVRKYFEDNKKELSWSERREVKKFLKNVETYAKLLDKANKGFKKEIEEIMKKGWTLGRIEKELTNLKKEIIQRILDSKEILDISHPYTGVEVNKDNLKDVKMEDLIKLIEENVEELNLVVNGKITE